MALQNILAQQEERNALCDEFLDLCTMHGESHPGDRKLARMFLERIERGEVGSPTERILGSAHPEISFLTWSPRGSSPGGLVTSRKSL